MCILLHDGSRQVLQPQQRGRSGKWEIEEDHRLRAAFLQFGTRCCYLPHVTRHTSHDTRHTSHITHHTSHITHHTSHITQHTSHITRHTHLFATRWASVACAVRTRSGTQCRERWMNCLSPDARAKVRRHTSHVTRHTSNVTRHTSHVTHHTSHVTRHA